MEEQRFFENPFIRETPVKMTDGSGQLLPPFKEKLVDNVSKLFSRFENALKTDSNSNDYSVYTGVAGYAYLYLHLSKVFTKYTVQEHKQTFLSAAQKYVEKALQLSKKNKSTFLCGTAGAISLAAIIYHEQSMTDKSDEMLKRLISIDSKHESYDEMLYGRAGILYSLMFAKQSIETQSIINSTHIRSVIEQILKSGQKTAQKECKGKPPLFYLWHDKAYVGAAHGLIGILCMLLECKEYLTEEEIDKLVKPTVDHMFNLRLKSGNYMSSVGSTSDRLIHWCHGATGAVFLFSLAHQIFKDEKYKNEVINCCELIWKRGILRKGYGICHGTAGNAYAFIRAYQLTNDDIHLFRAMKFAEWCFDYGKHGCRVADRPLSMFEGMAGTIYYLSDLLEPKNSRFPAFQLSA
ncbi:lanC-like protein 2 [Leptotrombidium deliense]|uniref:LanC-like protein 2 n=1 Tax=Leptotrombidium deliense TaxID=299467 RepID=A0A443SG04_9ACAR|nr:lanC-like protein 2 [Leptotrombidium deliense]